MPRYSSKERQNIAVRRKDLFSSPVEIVCVLACVRKSFRLSDPVSSSVNNIIFIHFKMSLT